MATEAPPQYLNNFTPAPLIRIVCTAAFGIVVMLSSLIRDYPLCPFMWFQREDILEEFANGIASRLPIIEAKDCVWNYGRDLAGNSTMTGRKDRIRSIGNLRNLLHVLKAHFDQIFGECSNRCDFFFRLRSAQALVSSFWSLNAPTRHQVRFSGHPLD
jgi:hypothetical protein